ncbi:hypothetical protein DPEC_G00344950 [Dallia pectoralis]|uniref:Uncharacterized protein n=1 Tax=Dallia pectoralis TaxID=75939 RepID=A0ACC2F3C6_DALPE|nr:hypothetical protein DPEC_G00344950 [Dallia pectoralis]
MMELLESCQPSCLQDEFLAVVTVKRHVKASAKGQFAGTGNGRIRLSARLLSFYTAYQTDFICGIPAHSLEYPSIGLTVAVSVFSTPVVSSDCSSDLRVQRRGEEAQMRRHVCPVEVSDGLQVLIMC